MKSAKRIFALLFLFGSFYTTFSQDTNVVKYSLFLEKTVIFGTVDTKIDEGSFKEGESFFIPAAELPSSPIDFSIYQNLYNALVGGRFGIDYGALDNDIILKIYIRNLDPNVGTYLNLGAKSDTMFSYFEIRIWELPDSNFYPEDSSYYFNEGYYAEFSLPKSDNLLNFLDLVGIDRGDSLAFSYLEGEGENEDWNGKGIESFDTPDSIKFRAIHLSRIGGGKRRIAYGNNPTGIKVNGENNLPKNYELKQNYPNPFNPSTQIEYSLKKNGNVKIDIYDVLGSHITTLVNSYQSAGKHIIEFSQNSVDYILHSGVYIYTLRSNGYTFSRKMILMK